VLAPHEPVIDPVWPIHVVSPAGGRLRIAVLGVLADHKGARTVAALAEAMDPATTEIHLIGCTENGFPRAALKRLKIAGRYEEAELQGLIASISPHVIWFPSPGPETFSYTLSVAIEAGYPIAASEIGSFTERLRGRPFTWLVDHRTSPAGWLARFDDIRAALSAEAIPNTARARETVADFYATDYLRPAGDRPAARPRRDRRVIAVVPERYDTGQPTPCAFIRLLQPLDHPAIAGDFEVVLADAKSVLDIEADIIVTQRYAVTDPRMVDALALHARKTGARLLYDLDDDLLHIPRGHPEAEELRPKAQSVRQLLGLADAVWVSTAALADRLGPAARAVTVVPNGLDERIWAASQPNHPAPSGPARLVCMGTQTHERDWAMIVPALVRLKAEYGPYVEIDVVGMSGGALPEGINRKHVPQHAGLSYPGFVHWLTSSRPGWQIGLAPLLDAPFNRSKSPIKAMDYAAAGLAVVASDMPVFRGSIADGPVGQLVAEDHRAWFAALDWLVRNRDLRLSLAAGARQAFLDRCSLAVQAESRRAAWTRLLQSAA
jgi:glycosyltransferase involved in cell wall biosynthesis